MGSEQSKVLAPHKPVAPLYTGPSEILPATLQVSAGAFWMTSPSLKSSLYLQNQLKTSGLTVTPVLYLSNGSKYTLADVVLEPSGIAIVNLNQQLAGKGIAPYATLSGQLQIQYKWAWGAVSGYVRNLDTAHSLVFPFGLRPLPAENAVASKQILEGMWWKEEPDVTGFLALANLTASSIAATVEVTDSQNKVLDSSQVTVAALGTKTLQLNERHGTSDQGGGVRVLYTGAEDAISVNAALQDEAVGYSESPYWSATKVGRSTHINYICGNRTHGRCCRSDDEFPSRNLFPAVLCGSQHLRASDIG